MSRQPHEVLNDALKQVEGAMGMDKPPRTYIPVRPPKPEPLAQIELPVLFHPMLQGGGPRLPRELPQGTAHMWVVIEVYGTRAIGELSGEPVIEDLRLECDGEDVTSMFESLHDEIANYIVNDN